MVFIPRPGAFRGTWKNIKDNVFSVKAGSMNGRLQSKRMDAGFAHVAKAVLQRKRISHFRGRLLFVMAKRGSRAKRGGRKVIALLPSLGIN